METCLIHIPHLFPLFSSFPSLSPDISFLTARGTLPWECDRSHYLLCCITFAQGHRETAKNLRRYSRPFNRVCPQSNSLWKMTSRSAFRCAGRGPAVTHPNTCPAKSCSTWVITWHRTPTTHRTLSVIFQIVNSGNLLIFEIGKFREFPIQKISKISNFENESIFQVFRFWKLSNFHYRPIYKTIKFCT